ncbi:MAG TPA: hypothetical protein VGR25_08785 [bacterium]|jgi:hypothetical protein|nr:hypothetical protein [bacterium]
MPVLGELEIFPHGEAALERSAEVVLRRIARDWAASDIRLKEQYCAILTALQAAEVEHAKREVEVIKHRNAHEENLTAIAALRRTQGRGENFPDEARLHPLAYGALMLALFIGEIPLNAIAFQIFPESLLLNYVITFALAVAMVGGAHFLGVFLMMERRSRALSWLMLVWVVTSLGVIVGIGLVRQGYLTALHIQLVEEARAAGEAAPRPLISPTMGTIVFVLINLLLYAVATVLSSFSHNPLAVRIRTTARPLQRSLEGRATPRKRVEELRTALHRIAAVRQKVFDGAVEMAHEERKRFEELIQEYRIGNMEVRVDKTLPPAFRRVPEIAFPGMLKALDWECPSPGDEQTVTPGAGLKREIGV